MDNKVKTPSNRRLWRPWQVLLLTLLSLVIVYFIYQWIYQQQIEARLVRAIQAAEEQTPSWRREELIQEYRQLNPSPGFPQVVRSIGGYLGWFGDDISERPGAIRFDRTASDFNVRFPIPYFKILKERLQATELAVLRQELKLFRAEPRPASIPFDNNFLIQKARTVVNYLLDEMELAAHEQRGRELIPLVEVIWKLTDFTKASPVAINQLVGMSCRSVGMSGIRRALAIGQLDAWTLKHLQTLMEQGDQSQVRDVLITLRAEFFDDLHKAHHDTAKRSMLLNELTGYASPGKTWQDQPRYYLQRFQVWSAMHTLSLAQAELLELGTEAITLSQSHPEQIPEWIVQRQKSLEHLIARRFTGTYRKLVMAELTQHAELRCLLVALACERYRLSSGQFPGNLTQLVPAYLAVIPVDPYSGKALLYARVKDGVVIYSVGSNANDDGGEVLRSDRVSLDRGVKLFDVQHRGIRYEEKYSATRGTSEP